MIVNNIYEWLQQSRPDLWNRVISVANGIEAYIHKNENTHWQTILLGDDMVGRIPDLYHEMDAATWLHRIKENPADFMVAVGIVRARLKEGQGDET